jgi:hypothetical protein
MIYLFANTAHWPMILYLQRSTFPVNQAAEATAPGNKSSIPGSHPADRIRCPAGFTGSRGGDPAAVRAAGSRGGDLAAVRAAGSRGGDPAAVRAAGSRPQSATTVFRPSSAQPPRQQQKQQGSSRNLPKRPVSATQLPRSRAWASPVAGGLSADSSRCVLPCCYAAMLPCEYCPYLGTASGLS